MEQKCSCFETPRRLQVAQPSPHQWGDPGPCRTLCRVACSGVSILYSQLSDRQHRAPWHFKSSLRARANRPRQWLFLRTFASAKLPFFKLHRARQSKQLTLLLLRMAVITVLHSFLLMGGGGLCPQHLATQASGPSLHIIEGSWNEVTRPNHSPEP